MNTLINTVKIDGKLTIDDKVVYLIGLNNEKVTDKIKGLTIWWCLY